jgi:hypothetical protein
MNTIIEVRVKRSSYLWRLILCAVFAGYGLDYIKKQYFYYGYEFMDLYPVKSFLFAIAVLIWILAVLIYIRGFLLIPVIIEVTEDTIIVYSSYFGKKKKVEIPWNKVKNIKQGKEYGGENTTHYYLYVITEPNFLSKSNIKKVGLSVSWHEDELSICIDRLRKPPVNLLERYAKL